MNRFRNAYRTRYCKTESTHLNQFDPEICNEKAVIEDLFEDIIDVTINTVPPRPVDWSTPVSLKSETPSLPIKEKGLLAPTSSETLVKIASKDSTSKSTESQVYCGPESGQACTVFEKEDCSGLVECTMKTDKNILGLEKERPNTLVDAGDVDDADHVYLAKDNAIHIEEEISETPPNHEMYENPAVHFHAFDVSAVLEPSSPTVKVQARKRLSFKDKETPSYLSKIKASEMPKQIEPEDQTKPFVLTSKSVPSANRVLEKDAEHRKNLHSKEITCSVTKQTTNEAEQVEKSKAGSKVSTMFLEKDESEMLALCPNEKPKTKCASMLSEAAHPQQRKNLPNEEVMNSLTKETSSKFENVITKADAKDRGTYLENEECKMSSLHPNEKSQKKFAAVLFEALHPERRLSVKAACPPPPPPHPPSPLSTINGLDEEFVIDEADSFTFKSWERDLKKVKPSGKLSTTAADGKRKQEKTISSQAFTSICSFDQTSVNNKSLFAATAINILPSNRENKVIVEKYQVRQAFTGKKDKCQVLSAPMAVEKPGEFHEKSGVPLTDQQVTFTETCVTNDIPSLTVPVGGDVKKNSVPFKMKMHSKKSASQTLARTQKKKKENKIATLEKASLEMQKTTENDSDEEAGTSVPQTDPNENQFSISTPSREGLVPVVVLENNAQHLLTKKVVKKPNVKIFKKSHIVRNVEDHTEGQSDEDITGHKEVRTKVSNAPSNKNKIKEQRSRKNKKNTSRGIRLLDTKEDEGIPISVENDQNESQIEVESHNLDSKRRRNCRPPSTWWVVNPEQDLLTKPTEKNEYIKVRKKSPKKLQTMKKLDTSSLKNVIFPSSPCEESTVGIPIIQNEKHQSENEGECSNSKRKRQPPSHWWAVNPEKDLLTFTHKSKKTVSRKLSKGFSETKRYKKETKLSNNLAKIALPDKIRKTDTLAANAAENERLTENSFENNGSERLVFLKENAERQSQSETDYCVKKRKINEATEKDIVHTIPGKKGKSILKANSCKFKLPVSDEEQMEEECEDPQTNKKISVPQKVESRVSVLRKSLLPSVKSHRLSSFKGSLESFGAAYSKTPFANKGNRQELETKLTSQNESPTEPLAKPDNSLDHSVLGVSQRKSRRVLYSGESESESVNEDNRMVENVDHSPEQKVCEEHFDKNASCMKTTEFHLKPFPEDVDILTKTIEPFSNCNKLQQKHNFIKVSEISEDFLKPNMEIKKARSPQQKDHFSQIEQVLDEEPEPNRYVKRRERLLKKVQFPHLSPTFECARVATPKRTIVGTPRRAKMSTFSQDQDYSDSTNTDSSMSEEMEGIEEIRENQQELSKNRAKVKIHSPQKKVFKRFLNSSVEKRVNSIVNKAAVTVTPTKPSDTYENHRNKTDDGSVLQSGSGQVPLRNVRRTSNRDKPVPFDLHESDSDPDHGDTSTDSNKDANDLNQKATKESNKMIHPSNTPNVRRSKRTRVRALEFWRGERVDYKMRPSGLVVDSVLLPEGNGKPPCKSKTKKHNKQIRKKDPVVFQDRTVTPTMPTPVLDPVNGKEIYLDCVKTQEECAVQSENGLLAIKSIIQPRFSMGKLILEPLQEKGFNFLHLHTLLFYVVDGAVMATVHFSSYQLKAGDYFFVPPGNIYNIRNLQEDARSSILFVRLKENVPVSEGCEQ